jgi:hypothetical protein
MRNDDDRPFEAAPLPGATIQERPPAVRESWRLDEERARQQAEWNRQEDEQRLARRLEQIAQRDQEEYRTPTAAGSLLEFLRHHWGVFRDNGAATSRSGAARSRPRQR